LTCVTDGGDQYGISETSAFKIQIAGTLQTSNFRTENGYDYLTIRGEKYSGTTPPPQQSFNVGEKITWHSDGSVVDDGWTLCIVPDDCSYNSGTSYTITRLVEGEKMRVMNIPPGVQDLTVRMRSELDLDINLFTAANIEAPFMTYLDGTDPGWTPKVSDGGTSAKLCADGCTTSARIPRTGTFQDGQVLQIDVSSDMGDELLYVEEVTESLILMVASYATSGGVITVAWQGSNTRCARQHQAAWLGELPEDMVGRVDTSAPINEEPTASPTLPPTDAPTLSPTDAPTLSPTDAPTLSPTGTCTVSFSSFIVLPAIAHV